MDKLKRVMRVWSALTILSFVAQPVLPGLAYNLAYADEGESASVEAPVQEEVSVPEESQAPAEPVVGDTSATHEESTIEATPAPEVSEAPVVETTGPEVTPEPTTTPELMDTEKQQGKDVDESTWQILPNGKALTRSAVNMTDTYTAPQNSKVTVHFTQLPDTPGNLTIQEIKLTEAQQKELGALSDTAYDISSSMENGTFKYDLTLPNPSGDKNAKVKYAEDVTSLGQAQDVTQKKSVDTDEHIITITGLNHFTIFSVSADTTPTGSNTFTTLSTFQIIAETVVKQVDKKKFQLNIPSGFVFDTSATVTASVSSGTCTGGGNNPIDLKDYTFTPKTTTQIEFEVKTQSKGAVGCASTISLSGVKVKPTAGTPLASISFTITNSADLGGATFDGQTVNEVVGVVSNTVSTLAASPTSVVADGTTTSTITATLVDQFGNPVSGQSVSLNSDTGIPTISTSPQTTDTSGVATFTVKSNTVASNVFTATNGGTYNRTVAVDFTAIPDTTAPVIAAHADVTVEATSAAGATVTYTSPATSDNVDPTGTATCVAASGTVFPIGTTEVDCDATDVAGNSATQTHFNVIVVDSTSPVIDAHTDITTEATSASGAEVTYTSPATTDAVDGAGVATCTPLSGTTFAIGTTIVTCTATDAHGNTGATTFDVIVEDTTDPVITVPADITGIESTSSAGAVVTYTPPTATDIVDGSIAVTCSMNSGDTFPIGTALITCSATDTAGNTGNANFNVTVVDTTAHTTVSSGIDSDWHNTDVVVTLTCSDTAGSGCDTTYYTTNGTTPTTTSAVYSAPFTLSATGEHPIMYFSVDNAGNQEAVQDGSIVKVDKVLPSVPVLGAVLSPTSNPLVAWVWDAATDVHSGIANYAIRLQNAVATTTTTATTTGLTYSQSLADDIWNFFVKALDIAGNESAEATLQVIVDTIAPTTPVANISGGDYVVDQTVTLSSTDANAFTIYYTLDGSIPTSASTLYTGTVTIDHSLTLKAIAIDGALNASPVMTETYAIAPVISEQTVLSVSTSNPSSERRINWTTDDPSTSRVVFGTTSVPVLGVNPNYGYTNSSDLFDVAPNKVTSHSVLIGGLNSNTTYFYRVISAGSPESVSQEYSFGTEPSSGGSGTGNSSSDTSSSTTSSSTGRVLGAKTTAKKSPASTTIVQVVGGTQVAYETGSGRVYGTTTSGDRKSVV